MAGKIPESFIQEVLARTDIVELIDGYIPLKKAGTNYSACCPFHTEKSPSFTVSSSKQFYHCFGCGAHGNALSFLMNYSHREFPEAVEMLANLQGLEVPREQGKAPNPRTLDLYELLKDAAEYFQKELEKSPIAQQYLVSRGLKASTLKQFDVGYSPDAWEGLKNTLEKKGHSLESLLTSGMVIKSEKGRCYDRFRQRIMIPIRDRRGRVIGFGGRILDKDGTPKYLNSPETPVFHKGSELYGLYEARQATNHLDKLLIVEGYMDVLALAEAGISFAVATLGTATTKQHLLQLYRQTNKLIFCFDGDTAGRNAAWKALLTSLPALEDGREALFVFLPEKEDPDSLVRKIGTEAFLSLLTTATPLSAFLFSHLQEQVDLTTLDGKATFVQLAVPLIQQIPKGAFQALLLEELKRKTRLSEEHLVEKMKSLEKPTSEPNISAPKKMPTQGRPTPIRLGITLLIQHPHLITLMDNTEFLEQLDLPGINLFKELIQYLKANPHSHTGTLVEYWRHREDGQHVMKLAATEHFIPAEGVESEFEGVLKHLKTLNREQTIEKLLQKTATNSISSEEKLYLQALINHNKER